MIKGWYNNKKRGGLWLIKEDGSVLYSDSELDNILTENVRQAFVAGLKSGPSDYHRNLICRQQYRELALRYAEFIDRCYRSDTYAVVRGTKFQQEYIDKLGNCKQKRNNGFKCPECGTENFFNGVFGPSCTNESCVNYK